MSEIKPMIETSDRGFTVNKTLGWTILVALVTTVFYAGSTLTQMQAGITTLGAAITQQQTSNTALEVRVRVLENQAGRFEEKLTSILNVVSRIDAKLEKKP